MAQQHAGDGATGGAGRGGGLSGLFSKVQGHLDKLGLDKLPAVDQIQSNIRQQMTAHNPRQQAETLKLQLALKAAGGVAQNLESLGREEQLYSKNLFQWGKDEDGEDLKDLTDRLAYLIFKSAEVQKAQAERIKQSRLALKDVRNFENELQPRRAKRAALAAKLQQLKTSSKTAGSQVQQVEADLAQLTQEEETFSESLAVLKRQKLHEAFRVHFEGQREMGEKLAVIAGYAEVLLNGMETSGVGKDYDGMEKTAAVRASVAEKLDAYNPATPLIPTPQLQLGSSFLGRQDTGSFGTTHAHELSQIETGFSSPFASGSLPSPTTAQSFSTPPVTKNRPDAAPVQQGVQLHDPPVRQSSASSAISSGPSGLPPINLAPTSPPAAVSFHQPPSPSLSSFATATGTGSGSGSELLSSSASSPPLAAVPEGPTVAETGAPIVGTGGPQSGQLEPRSPVISNADKAREWKEREAALDRERQRLADSQGSGLGVGSSSAAVGDGEGDVLPPPEYTSALETASPEEQEAIKRAQLEARLREAKGLPSSSA